MLISDIEKNPNSIILMDEIEKSHPDVSNILLTLMDEGMVTSSNGKKADCRNCIVILTSNLGSAANEGNAIGFGRSMQKTGEDDKAVKDFFKPEFRNRLDGIVKFNKLDQFSMRKIVGKFVKEVNDLMVERKITIRVNELAVDHLIAEGFDAKMGARPLQRKINELIKVPLSKKILFEDIQPNSLIVIDYVNNELTFDVQSQFGIAPTPIVNNDGFIVLDTIKS
jgi:ATP-dependent Clp protease ATP-binding subunit ClpA